MGWCFVCVSVTHCHFPSAWQTMQEALCRPPWHPRTMNGIHAVVPIHGSHIFTGCLTACQNNGSVSQRYRKGTGQVWQPRPRKREVVRIHHLLCNTVKCQDQTVACVPTVFYIDDGCMICRRKTVCRGLSSCSLRQLRR